MPVDRYCASAEMVEDAYSYRLALGHDQCGSRCMTIYGD